MRPESGILGCVALFVVLAGLGHSKAAQAANDELAKELSRQMATLIGAPDEGESVAVNGQSVEPVVLGSPWALLPISTFEPAPLDRLFDADDVVQGQYSTATDIGAGSGAWTFHLTTATRDLSGAKTPSAGRAAAAPKTVQTFDPLTDHFWPLAKDGRSTDVSVTFGEQLDADETTDDKLLSLATADGGEPDASPGPTNFQISKSVKIKAQPVGGGLGGRVTFTFLLPTGAER